MDRKKGTGEEGSTKNSYILGRLKGKPENFLGERPEVCLEHGWQEAVLEVVRR